MFRALMFAIVLIAASCFYAVGQTTTGVLQGRVVDSTGAAVPDAKVTIRNEATGTESLVPTNGDGNFIQSFLLPGDYSVGVEKSGFQKYVTSHIRVDVEQKVDLQVVLKIGDLTTTVEVSATGTQLATASSTVSTVISGHTIEDLPLNGRNPMSLVNLTPGVQSQNGASTPWISGGRNGTSEITVDGTSIILPENNVGINTTGYTPIVDSVEEFTVVTNSLAAEYGRTGGGTINLATRSGTNSLHGSAYDYLQNSQLNANTWSNNRNGAIRSPYQNNWFGATIGGPVWLGKLYNGKNKTFFFFSEQSNRQRTTSSFTGTMPLDAWRNGDFSQLKNGSGVGVTVYDPLAAVDNGLNTGTATRAAFPGNVIPQNRWDPVAAGMMKYWPEPNLTPLNIYTQQNNFYNTGKTPSNDDKFDSRMDHNFSERLRAFARGSFEYLNQGVFNGFGAGNIGSSNVTNGGPNKQNGYNVTTNWIYTFNPTTILNVNVGYAHFNEWRVPVSEGVCPGQLGFPSYLDAEAKTNNCEFPNISVGGASGGASMSGLGQATYTTLFYKPTDYNLRSDLTKIRGNHQIKFGAEFRKMFMNFTQQGLPDGQFGFTTNWTQQVTTAGASSTQGFGLASFLLGTAGSGSISHTMDIAEASAYWGLYVQDDWKVSPRLTINLGARWEVDVPRTERYNRLSYFDINAPSPLGTSIPVPAGSQCPGCSNLRGVMNFVSPANRHQVPADINNIGPRLGFAYRINDKTVFRGAYSVMYAGSVLQAAGTSGSSGTEGFTSQTGMSPSFDSNETVAAYFRNPFPLGFNLPLGQTVGPASGVLTDIGNSVGESFFSDNSNPMIQQWSGTLQREVRGNMLLEAGYIGSGQHHLIDGENMQYNQVPDQYMSLGTGLNAQVPNPFNGIIQSKTSTYYNHATTALSNLLKPYPQYTGVNSYRKPGANANYNAFLAKVQKRYSNGLTFLVALTLSKLLDDASTDVNFLGATGSKQDYYNRKNEKSLSSQDESRMLVISSTYELPIGNHGQFLTKLPRGADYLIGGWQVNGIYTYNTGTPIALGNGGNTSGLSSGSLRPTNNGQSGKLSGPVGNRINQYFNTAVFSQTPNYTWGTVGRFLPDIRYPSGHYFDSSLFKTFRIHEQTQVEFRAESFNFFNHPIWGGPNTTVNATGAAGFGTITSKSGNRTVQLALRVRF
ncbi:MAG: TonB-dependent receptor [Candidatus Sulfopaludibacter sp.]|nr:TonB-dependent receptor [Candidatus Sulfopaludibacter sp.]